VRVEAGGDPIARPSPLLAALGQGHGGVARSSGDHQCTSISAGSVWLGPRPAGAWVASGDHLLGTEGAHHWVRWSYRRHHRGGRRRRHPHKEC
jgi:hypothetical protein